MFDFISIYFYTPLYYYILLFVVLFTSLQSYTLSINSIKTVYFNKYFGGTVLIFVLLYMGLRPIHGVFTDMTTYARQFSRVQEQDFNINTFNDPIYGIFLYLSTRIVTVQTFFVLCAILYIAPIFIASKKWFKNYWFYGFLILISTFTFWSYGVNGIRNGIATSLFILALSRSTLWSKILIFGLSIGFHMTMALPLIGYILANNLNIKIKYFFFIWVVSVPLSLLSGGFWEQLFASIGFDDDRLSYLTSEIDEGKFSGTGFRWDFLIFSALPVFFGYYYVYKKRFHDKGYNVILSTYLFANSFWILVIRANYSNRFAYLSWFIIGLIIVYPLLKQHFLKNQHKKIGSILLAYFAFTFIMNVILN